MGEGENYALKDMFDADRFRFVAAQVKAVYPAFDSDQFTARSLKGLADLELLQRMRRMTEGLRAFLPSDYLKSLAILRKVAPQIEHNFVAIVLSDFVGQYGLDYFDESMDALRYFTQFGSSEFAVREFLRRDLARSLAIMEKWSGDENEHVRRLSSEGCRPRLPWSFRIEALIKNPNPVARILENLRCDESLYVRKSVANHLNDITKDHPEWVLDRLKTWPLDDARAAWIAKRALRTLIKKGDRKALSLIGVTGKASISLKRFSINPPKIHLGERVTISAELRSTAKKPQRLVIDYAVHYVKKSGAASAKVFKWKETTLAPSETLSLSRTQVIRDFTTRVHHPGRHDIELLINGDPMARAFFILGR